MFSGFCEKGFAMLMVKIVVKIVVKIFFLSFGEDVLGVTNAEQEIQSCQTREPASSLGCSSAAHR